jgi:hypothetical protein
LRRNIVAMMSQPLNTAAHVIQLALTPIFLLTALACFATEVFLSGRAVRDPIVEAAATAAQTAERS